MRPLRAIIGVAFVAAAAGAACSDDPSSAPAPSTPDGGGERADANASDAGETIVDLAYNLLKRAYNLDEPAATRTPELV